MNVDIPIATLELLKEVLTILDKAEQAHFVLHDDEELIEPWLPDGAEEQISCPELTVGLLRKAQRVKKQLRL